MLMKRAIQTEGSQELRLEYIIIGICKFEIGGVIMEKKFVEVTLNEKVIENHSCSNGCQRAQGSSTGG